MTTDEDQPDSEPRGRGRPPGTTTRTPRWHRHTDAERDDARGDLRMAGDTFQRAADAYWKALRRREEAAYNAYKVGLNDPEIGRVLGEAQSKARGGGEEVNVAPSEVSRMRARQRGEVKDRARLVAKARRERR